MKNKLKIKPMERRQADISISVGNGEVKKNLSEKEKHNLGVKWYNQVCPHSEFYNRN